eukprot:TRINITY_DN67061_c0_g1_i1.p1 TRINITY_DN67061_c0_g1~~TRINITY_DN67061_c0_g1_i1.p1  ORF type:complete len:695 (-),score=148.90 TRINITY_DN67061_c0_g1_i1:284-2368(-)
MMMGKRTGDPYGGDQKRYRPEPGIAQMSCLEAEFFVKQHLVGWLIGKSGATLREVEMSFGVKVSLDQSSKDQGFSKVRVGGEPAGVQAAAEHMNASLARAATGLGGDASGDGPVGPFLLDGPPEHPGDTMVEDMRIEQALVGWLLGKSGGVVREVETTSGTMISINQETKQLGYSKAFIHGPKDRRDHAKQLISDSLERARNSGPPPTRSGPPPTAAMAFGGALSNDGGRGAGDSEDMVQVEQKWIGWLLGRGGGVVREIEQESGCKLTIDQTTKQLGYSTIQLQGDVAQIQVAKDAITRSLGKVGAAPMASPGVSSFGQGLGGGFSGGFGGGLSGGVGGNSGGSLGCSGAGGYGSVNGNVFGGCGGGYGAGSGGGSGGYGNSSGGYGCGAGGSFGGGGSVGGTSSVQLQIDQQWVGWLVGKGGGMVKEIEMATGAKISLNQGTKAMGYSVATVAGEMPQVESAQNMIVDKIQRVSGGSGVALVSGQPRHAATGGDDDLDLKRAVAKVAAASNDPAFTAQLQSLLNSPGGSNTPEQFVELQLEQKYVGWLLGSKGKTVQDIEAATGAKVGIDQTTKELGYSVLKLTGSAQACQRAQERIEASLARAVQDPLGGGLQDGVEEETMQVEQNKVGWILGKGGVVMKEIESQCGARISIDQSTKDMGFSVVGIRGGPQECQLAKQLITDKIQQAGPSR